MPDITMCSVKNCPKSQTCYRAQATPSQYQSYAAFGIVGTEGNSVECGYYLPIVSGSAK